MEVVLFCAAIIGTIISMVSLTRLAAQEHDRKAPRTLSELVAAQDHLLWRFRKILWFCGSLFAVTVYGLILPKIDYAPWVFLAWTVTYVGDLSLAVVPARQKTQRLHDVLGQAMAIGMLAMAFLFWLSLSEWHAPAEGALAIGMTGLAILTLADKKRFLFYELPFLYLSHFSILIAGLGVM